MARPITTENMTAPTTRATPISIPSITRREDDGKHADSRSGIQESYGRPQTGTALVDAGEQWKYGA